MLLPAPPAPPSLIVGEPIPVPVLKGVLERPGGWLMGANRKGSALVVRVSGDGGRTWIDRTVAARSERPDLGDGNLVQRKDGSLALCYRDNAAPEYAIRVVQSGDGGRNWSPPQTVATSNVQGRGLWAPFLLPLRTGELLCFYDDEAWPARWGRPGHQWIAVRRLYLGNKTWSSPLVASRRPDSMGGDRLGRDGMFVAVEASDSQLVGVVEDVDPKPPHPSGIYLSVSGNGGWHWRWTGGERPPLFRPKWPHMAVSPALCRLPDGRLLCAFGTDQGLAKPSKSGTLPHLMPLETWGSLSSDDGKSWGLAFPIHRGTARDYLAALTPGRGGAWLNVLDFDRGPLLIPISVVRESEVPDVSLLRGR